VPDVRVHRLRPTLSPHARVGFVVAFAAAAFAAGTARAITTTYLPLLLDRIDDNPGLIGVVMLVNAAAGMAIPLVTGIWSDRRSRRGARRMPFVIGGTVVAAGGLAAVALGSSASYLILAVAAAVVYTGLNTVTTAHRALIPELFDASARPRATSAQELALLAGGLVGVAAGGALTIVAPWAPFAAAAAALPLLVAPTVRRTREPDIAPAAAPPRSAVRYYLHAAARPGIREILAAQVLWVLGYAALPAFFLLYAKEVLGLEPSVAGAWLAAFGIATGGAVAAAGRARDPRLHRSLLVLGVGLLGGGFLTVAATTELAVVAVGLAAAAAGFGLVSTIGFPLFAASIPEGEAGSYSALYFSVRAISSAIALPAAGLSVELTGSYRTLFVLGGAATFAALVPLAGRPRAGPRVAGAGVMVVGVGVLGVLVAHTSLRTLDEDGFRTINGLGPGPHVLWTTLDPHTRNYAVLIAAAAAAAAATRRAVIPVVARVLMSAMLAWGLLEAVYSFYDRDRPEEVVVAATANGHSWARLNSFPSGHMAITAALAAAIAMQFPRLRVALWSYVAAVAFTRVLFGAHFPADVLAGTALGTAAALLVAELGDRSTRRAAATTGREMAEIQHARRAA
jgi:membrane-associated phospholipid phosphatase/Na+/melibiose symporter-like transporter